MGAHKIGVFTVPAKRSIEMQSQLKEIKERVEGNGYKKELHLPEIERLMVKFPEFQQMKEKLIEKFHGVEDVRPEIRRIMNGTENAQ